MPTPDQNILIIPDTAVDISVALEPANNALHSLMLLTHADKYSGLDQWVENTLSQMSEGERQTHLLVMEGLYGVVMPDQSWGSFPAYLDQLASADPFTLRQRILDGYLRMEPCEEADLYGELITSADAILQSASTYLRFLHQRFGQKWISESIETQAYTYLNNPPAMQQMVVSHLRTMWEKYLAAEWQRVLPMLTDSVRAFAEADLGRMERIEAVEFVTGRPFTDEHLTQYLNKAERIVFVPSAHVGPYLGKFKQGHTFGLMFGARLPEGTAIHAPALDRSEIVVHLTALADDTRLQILQMIAEAGELRSQDIMRDLELSQSAASRHLKQLSANGYVSERRSEGAKCYQLNPDRIHDTLGAIGRFITQSQAQPAAIR